MKSAAITKRTRGRPKSSPDRKAQWMREYPLRLPPDLAEHADRHGGAEYVRSLLRRALIKEQIV
jgi:hypothetical protein